MLKKPPIWAEIGEIDGFIAIFYSSKMKWKSNFSKSLNSSNQPWFIWIVFWILHSKTLQKTCILQNWKKNHELHTLNMLWRCNTHKRSKSYRILLRQPICLITISYKTIYTNFSYCYSTWIIPPGNSLLIIWSGL